MKLKYYLSLLTIFFLVSFISSQNPQPDKRLLDYFGQEKLDILMKNSPDIIYYYNFYLDNSWIIEELPQEKLNSKSILGVISLATNSSGNIDLQNINILKLNIKREYPSGKRKIHYLKILYIWDETCTITSIIFLYNQQQ